MTIEHVEVLVEEPSMDAVLRELLPKILGPIGFEIYPYQCKDDLLAKLPERLNGYASWLPDHFAILVVVDRDDDDCRDLKAKLDQIARDAGLVPRSDARGGRFAVINRIAIEELEAWCFGDWQAVRKAYPGVSEHIPNKKPYRDPDGIRGGTWEAFERVLQKAGYFKGGLRKIEAAREIAQHMSPARNTSPSFQALCRALDDLKAARPLQVREAASLTYAK